MDMQQNLNSNTNHPTNYLNFNADGQPNYVSNPQNSQLLPPGIDPRYVPSSVTVTITYTPQFYDQFGATPAAVKGVTGPNPAIQSDISKNLEKGPKNMKIAQSARCEICNIECNSRDVLDQQKLGKKHKKNLKKSTVTIPAASIPLSVSTSVPIDKPIIGSEDNSDKGKLSKAKKTRKGKAIARTEDVETKRRKVIEGGGAVDALRTCTICDVVCNSETVFNYHLNGKMHAINAAEVA